MPEFFYGEYRPAIEGFPRTVINRTLIPSLVFQISLCLFFAAPSLAAQKTSDPEQEARNFIHVAETRLAPVYPALAGHIVDRFGLAKMKGLGIDLGSGPGHLVIELARRTERMEWINADINPHYFQYFLEKASQAGVAGRVKAVEADAQSLPFDDNTADIVVSRGSFQFWEDKEKAFAEIYRVLKPGGRAFIGRGLPGNLPPETARKVRERAGHGPDYDVAETAVQLENIMRALKITDYRVEMPRPAGSEDVSYGVWIEFSKPAATKQGSEKRISYYDLDTLVVIGSAPRDPVTEPRTEPLSLEPAATVVTQAEIARSGAKTLIEAMEYVPGAWIESRGRKVKQFFSIRGQKYPYPDYALDGAWQREFLELPYFFPAEEVERIEIMRSSAALFTGLSGLTGVINIVPREYRQRETAVQGEYGSFGTYRLNLSHGGVVKNLSYALDLGFPGTDGPKGRYAAESFTNLRGSLYWRPNEKWKVSAHLMHLNGSREMARAVAPASLDLREASEKFDPFRATLATVKAFYQPSERVSSELIASYSVRDNRYISQSSSSVTSSREYDYEWGANFTQSVTPFRNNILRFGSLYNHWVAPNGKRFYVGKRCDLETFSWVAGDEQSLGPLTLNLGLRWARTYINNYGAFNINESPKGLQKVTPIRKEWEPAQVTTALGASWEFSPSVSAHFNLAAGEIKPLPGNLTTDLTEPENEKRLKIDLGLMTRRDNIGQLSLAWFLSRQEDALVLSGQTVTVEGRVLETFLNRNQRQTGIEIDARSATVLGCLQLFANFVAMSPRAEIEGRMVRDRETPRVISSGGFFITKSRYDLNLFLKTVSAYESTRFAESTAGQPLLAQPLGAYQTLNLTFGHDFGSGPFSRVYLELTNLANDKYSTVVGYPDYGRRLTAGWRVVFK